MSEEKKQNHTELTFCNWCNQPTTVIWVHGHGQCAICGINIDECCRGEICEFPESENNLNLRDKNEG